MSTSANIDFAGIDNQSGEEGQERLKAAWHSFNATLLQSLAKHGGDSVEEDKHEFHRYIEKGS